MPEPDSIQFECIGCGTMNPASAEVCAGCGHRFLGESGSRPDPDAIQPRQAGRFVREFELMADSGPTRDEQSERAPRSTVEVVLTTITSVFVVLIGLVAIVIGLGISLFIAFFSLCLGGKSGLATVGIGLSVLLFLGIAFGIIKMLAAFFRTMYKRQ